MKYISAIQAHDNQKAPERKRGLLITNLGSPDAPKQTALRKYLKQFLWDPRVVEVPRPLWWLILNGIILNVRPKKSARLYATVWTDAGAPLIQNTREQAAALQQALEEEAPMIVDFAMRYGDPSIEDALLNMQRRGVDDITVLPLYPQYSGATTGSTFDAVAAVLRTMRWVPSLRFIGSYHDHSGYIEACVAQIRSYQQQWGKPQKLLLSYHGIPQRYFDSGDPYYCHCHKTTRLIVEALGLDESEYLMCFQSRFGREEWLKPYTDKMLESLPKEGVKNVQIFCPGFAADCLETLEEIAIQNKTLFIASGGQEYDYIPALNATSSHINALLDVAKI